MATGLKADSSDLSIKLNYFENQVSMIYDPSIDSTSIGKFRLNASFVGNQMMGSGTDTDGKSFNWTAMKTKTFQEPIVANDPIQKEKDLKLGPVYYPFTAYGTTSTMQAEKMLIKNATIWTNESPAVLTETDVLINNGKIVQIGKNIQAPDAKVIDASGKYLTSGIIDEHSHIAITRGVNEGTQSNTAEVRIGDALDPDDINIYRQLAGGVTTSHPYTKALLSANPRMNSDDTSERIILKGDIPNPINRPSGCVFNPRCPKVQEICKSESPALIQIGNRKVACHFPEN